MVACLLEDPVEHSAAKPGGEETAQTCLNGNIDRDTPVFSAVLVLNLAGSPGQMLLGGPAIVFDPLGHINGRILATAFAHPFAVEQLIREVIDARKQLRV